MAETPAVPQHITRPARPDSQLTATRAVSAGSNPSSSVVDEAARNRGKTSPCSSPIKAPSRPPKKSCLTKNTTTNVVPARLNPKKKTVAFGKTVNVSQTIEVINVENLLVFHMHAHLNAFGTCG